MSIDYSFLDSIEERVEAEIQDWLEFLDYESYIAATAATLVQKKSFLLKSFKKNYKELLKVSNQTIETDVQKILLSQTMQASGSSATVNRLIKDLRSCANM